ncbi:MAG TPA: MMPL family transporter, partial [Ktedonobacteraceae bacterium]|nr:MMPL family transporter [Ktedonobacteraceae bacterium]
NQWIFHRFVAHPPGQFMALGLIYPTADAKKTAAFTGQWPEALQKSGIVLSGWQLLGSTVFDLVIKELPLVITPIVVLVIVSLWLAFRNWREMVLSIVCVTYTGLCLLALMVLLGWKWNLLNLMAIPLLLGMGVDFGIHIQIALKRYGGDLLAVRRSVGRALLLAGSTTVVGFVSLAFSQNSGMASLGQVCALGILLAMIVSIYLLPVWWKAFRKAEGGRIAVRQK